jgi:hypothetical protein
LCVVAEPEEDDTSMRPFEPKHEFSKVSIISDENALFVLRKGEHLDVGQTSGIVGSDAGDVMTL